MFNNNTNNISAYRITGNDETFIDCNCKQSYQSIWTSTCCQQTHHWTLSPRETITAVTTATTTKSLHQKLCLKIYLKLLLLTLFNRSNIPELHPLSPGVINAKLLGWEAGFYRPDAIPNQQKSCQNGMNINQHSWSTSISLLRICKQKNNH